MGFTEAQLNSIEVSERVTSVLSLIGTSFIIVTFLVSRDYHKPINRLVFYASFGNIITNVATLISRTSLRYAPTSPLCQIQAFLIQMFMPADSLWTLSMAFNVYLVFFRKYSSSQLKKLEWKYFLGCYGIPAAPAITYLFIDSKKRGRPYGPATLWCWITPKWDPLRVATFYGPVWLVVIITITIYVIVGIDIFKKRNQLRQFSSLRNGDSVVSKTTHVEVTSEPAQTHIGMRDPWELRSVPTKHSPTSSLAEYSITIESSRDTTRREPLIERPLRGIDTNSASWGYARIAFIFFVALLVTWVPSSINRVYSLAHPEKKNYPMNFVASFVLPLQGFWNGLIYFTTSLPESRKLWARMTASLSLSREKRIQTPASPQTDIFRHRKASGSISQGSFY